MSSRIMEELLEEAQLEGVEKARKMPLEELRRSIAEYDRIKKIELRQHVVWKLLTAGPLSMKEIGELIGVPADEAARLLRKQEPENHTLQELVGASMDETEWTAKGQELKKYAE